ncbi:TIGR02452 family protein [Limibacter armeniacum]|uniref:TIGR02452 family protein n=1 Tax=Limibacter armeniacum TaxID=466084 RepID=UPI002FE53335
MIDNRVNRLPLSWNPVRWLKDFEEAIRKNHGYKELRSQVFEHTVRIVKDGHYTTKESEVEMDTALKDKLTADTVFYNETDEFHPLDTQKNKHDLKIEVLNADCLDTVQNMLAKGFNPALLNMASRRNPGGGVLQGAGAQEENIFRRSNLFVSLYQFIEYAAVYGVRPHHRFKYPINRASGGIYSPGVTVFRSSEETGYGLLDTPYQVSVVTVPAINRPALIKQGSHYLLRPDFIAPTKQKIRTVLRIAAKHGHDSLVLSAFGCGAFCNPPKHIARLFQEVFAEEEFQGVFSHIVFAIREDKNTFRKHNPEGNLKPFQEVFEEFQAGS